MKIATHVFEHLIEVKAGEVTSVIIEHPTLYRRFAEGLHSCVETADDCFTFSQDGDDVCVADSVVLLTSFVPFTLNTKALQAALVKKLEKLALLPQVRDRTDAILNQMTTYVKKLTLEIPCAVECGDLTIGTLIKGCNPVFPEEDAGLANRIVNYMRLVRMFVGERVFVFIGARAFFTQEELIELLNLLRSDQFSVLLVDPFEVEPLPCEHRLLVDRDMCELTSEDDDVIL